MRCGGGCHAWSGVFGWLTALAMLPACSSHSSHLASTTQPPTSTAAGAVSTTTTAALPATRTAKWVDLAVGDCLADPPPADPSVLNVTIVDCTAPHRAEVYVRAPVAVNAAIADVADQQCAAGFPHYTGRPLNGSPYTITYLIDSNQDRTSANPTPSTVICLLQSANGQTLTASARR